MTTRWIGRSVVMAVALTMIQAAVGFALLGGERTEPGAAGFAIVANALTALVMTYLALHFRPGGGKRAGLLFLVLFGIQANNLVEAVFFGLGIPAWRLFLNSFLVSAAFAALLGWGGGPPSPAALDRARRSRRSWAVRIATCDLAYVVAYFTAGLVILPYVQDFYRTRSMPDAGLVFAMQFPRGLVFAGIALLVVRGLDQGRFRAAVWVGLTLSIVGGVAPLIVPNPYLPTPVRLVHLLEVGVSNFLFGLLAGWLLGVSPTPGRATAGEGPLATAA